MRNSKYLLFTLMILSAILLGACNLPANLSTQDANATIIAATANVVFTRAAETAGSSSNILSTATTAPLVATALPTNTPVPTIPPVTATNTPIPCNRASFVKDVTYPDDTAVPAGTVFTKKWQIKNNGSCAWTSGYVLLFDSGDQMNAPATGIVTAGTVAPGASVEISVDLTAPASPGTYQGRFKLRSPDNIVFGINADAQGPFWVQIVVPDPTPTPTATPTTAPPTLPPPPPPLMPDLVITDITYNPAAPHKGDLVTVKVSTYNQGTVAAGPYTVEWYAAGPTLGCSWPVTGNNAGGGKVLTCTYTYGGWNHGYVTKAIADTANTVAEGNESNNTTTQILDVSP